MFVPINLQTLSFHAAIIKNGASRPLLGEPGHENLIKKGRVFIVYNKNSAKGIRNGWCRPY
jgi:hypothetical protein